MPNPIDIKTAKGTVYRVRFVDGGRSRSKTFREKRHARRFCRNIEEIGVKLALLDIEQLEAHGSSGVGGVTLTDVFEQFIEWKAPRVRSVVTIANYRTHFEGHIKPTFGDTPIGEITPADVARWVDDMVNGTITNQRNDKKLSPKTIRERHALLHSIFAWATAPERQLIAVNPCATITNLPKKIKPQAKGLMPKEWAVLYGELLAHDPDAADLAAFLIGSGWRIGEAMALNVAGVEDYGYGPIYVTMQRVAQRQRGQTVIIEGEGKSQGAMRRIQLDEATSAIVRRLCEGKGLNDLIFSRGPERRPWHHHNFRAALDRATQRAEMKHVTAHSLRHTHVAWLAMAGAPLPELQRRLGHANISTTIGVYGGMIGDVKGDTLAAFARMRDSTPVAIAGTIESADAHPGSLIVGSAA